MSKPKANTVRGVQSLLRSGVKGNYSAGNGLYLAVNGKGVGSWLFRYQMDGKRERIGLGSVEAVSLAEANAIVIEHKKLIAQGINPKQRREQQRLEKLAAAITFDEVAKDYIQAKRSEWKSIEHAKKWQSSIDRYASPIIGHLPPAEITKEHVLQILQPIWETKNATASEVRNRVEVILNKAKADGLRENSNPAAWRGNLEFSLSKKQRGKHRPSLPWQQVPAFWQELGKTNSVATPAIQFTILTACRRDEVRLAKWDEFDFEQMIWSIPAERMKQPRIINGAKQPHRVPITKAMLELLNTLPRLPSGLLFEGESAGNPVGAATYRDLFNTLDARSIEAEGGGWRDNKGRRITLHGFRTSFRTWASEETSSPWAAAELALAHSIGGSVEQAYNRTDLLERRRELMEHWGEFVTGASNVVQLVREVV